MEQGELLEKQKVLIMLVDKKFGATEKEKECVLNISDPAKLDMALATIIASETLDEVLSELK